jgi:hypothetical protein
MKHQTPCHNGRNIEADENIETDKSTEWYRPGDIEGSSSTNEVADIKDS